MDAFIEPMKAVTAPLPTDRGWAFEVKWDGMRIVAAVDGGEVAAWSARGAPAEERFPELAELVGAVGGRRAVLDGEVVALDEAGRSSFSRLQNRMHLSHAERVAHVRREVPVTFVAFDLLRLDGNDLFTVPYADRRRLLLDLVEPAAHLLVPGHVVDDGAALFAAAAANGLEGLMAKRVESTYQPGRRSPAWRKCKVRRRQEVVIGGWASGEGRRADTIGSLLVGVHDPGRPGNPLLFAGGVGTGFTDADLDRLRARFAELEVDECPFEERPTVIGGRQLSWVRPELVAEVEFGEWTPDGRLRHPSYLGLRSDKDPDRVIREPDGSAG
ncbi:MAG: polymerase LigD, ligase domain protein [Acidimicrobiales bacterium]|nr:polymerase LigD, ligase domain protein [Acidimicrobiales bacterium]